MDVKPRPRPVNFAIYMNNTERHDDDGNMPDKSYQSLVRIKSQNADNTYDVLLHEEATSRSTEKNKLKNGNTTTWKILALLFCMSTVILGGAVAYLSAKILSVRSDLRLSAGKNQTGLDQDLTCKCNQTLIDPCRRSPCKNNGVCTENGNDYKCDCPKGFSASDCHETPCDNFPCKHQGRCENIGSGRNCNCKEGYTGKDCEETPCSGSPCKNGGFCSNRGSIYHCTCPLGTSGINCENISCGFPEYRRNVLNQKTCNISPCLKDWIFNIATFSCYWIDIRKARWNSANKICQSKGASLAFIQSLEEIKWLEQFINENVWVGGRAAKKQYRWQSSEYNYAIHNQSNLWTQNEPGSFNRNYCVQLGKRTESFLLDDTACYYEKRFICKTTNLPGI
ncbi:neurocan core protein-like [Mytilus edulis]|uniref:neurocan core protein-like n=1 Tax=Mytilus edulis TaxID=6550 RepID=UPI0039EFD16B